MIGKSFINSTPWDQILLSFSYSLSLSHCFLTLPLYVCVYLSVSLSISNWKSIGKSIWSLCVFRRLKSLFISSSGGFFRLPPDWLGNESMSDLSLSHCLFYIPSLNLILVLFLTVPTASLFFVVSQSTFFVCVWVCLSKSEKLSCLLPVASHWRPNSVSRHKSFFAIFPFFL